ncbi:hypothetical protein AVMA1855_13985 [Acidovorax sp. SUPP1855]|uniref:hypothetical protein n=1 Tax=Acidovorax sp. SUPP1855 TaxID=431774 RepID=UPI0023DE1C7A|nr:hypothetical protein [Acidovorax sp. SUPP1855]GKS85271.1 hypothetical protein AVMA1855_13985 [Acidovorax sp. SUPP1855]
MLKNIISGIASLVENKVKDAKTAERCSGVGGLKTNDGNNKNPGSFESVAPLVLQGKKKHL